MSLYTITLDDYLHEYNFGLPAAFDLIPLLNGKTFSQLFEKYFLNWEIGFETCEMFSSELTALADLICPLYAEKITQINNKINSGIFDNKSTKTLKNYENNSDISVLDERSQNSAVTEETSGLHGNESNLDAIVKFENDVKNLYMRLIHEFYKAFTGLC